jgi:hypothetical protein
MGFWASRPLLLFPHLTHLLFFLAVVRKKRECECEAQNSRDFLPADKRLEEALNASIPLFWVSLLLTPRHNYPSLAGS